MKVYKSEQGKRRLWASYGELLQGWGTPVEERSYPSTFGDTHVVCAGSEANPPLLLFHGVGDDAAMMWVYNAKSLAQHFFLIAVDVIGGPGKSAPNGQYEAGFDAKVWIAELLDAMGIARAHIAGVSYGCHLVQMMLTELPDRVDRAVGMAGLPALEGARESKWRGILRFLPEALFPTDRNCLKLMKKLSGANSGVFTDNEALWTHWKQILRDFNQQSMMRQNMKPVDPARLLQARNRALFIVGARDLSDPRRARQAQDAGFSVTVLPDTGHGVNHERANAVNEMIIQFLTCPSPAASRD